MIVGGYTLDLYCDRKSPRHEWREFPHTFQSERGSHCRAEARSYGWVFKRDGTALCPKCSGKPGPGQGKGKG